MGLELMKSLNEKSVDYMKIYNSHISLFTIILVKPPGPNIFFVTELMLLIINNLYSTA